MSLCPSDDAVLTDMQLNGSRPSDVAYKLRHYKL